MFFKKQTSKNKPTCRSQRETRVYRICPMMSYAPGRLGSCHRTEERRQILQGRPEFKGNSDTSSECLDKQPKNLPRPEFFLCRGRSPSLPRILVERFYENTCACRWAVWQASLGWNHSVGRTEFLSGRPREEFVFLPFWVWQLPTYLGWRSASISKPAWPARSSQCINSVLTSQCIDSDCLLSPSSALKGPVIRAEPPG